MDLGFTEVFSAAPAFFSISLTPGPTHGKKARLFPSSSSGTCRRWELAGAGVAPRPGGGHGMARPDGPIRIAV